MPKLLIVGKNSYIGARLCAALAGRADVIGLSSADCNLLSVEQTARCFSRLGPRGGAVVFLAVVNKYVRNSYELFLDNVAMVRTFLSAVQQVRPSAILYFSSVDVYGDRPALPITEESPLRPNSWYALAKHACEWMLLSSGEAPCPVTVLRIPGVYGPAANERSVVGGIARRLLSGETIGLTGGGRVRRDFVFVGDLCRAVEALVPLRYHGILNVATGRSVSMAEVVGAVATSLGVAARIEELPDNPARDFDLAFDTARFQSLLPGFRFTEMAAVAGRSNLWATR